jgi:hypothetical protein
MSVRSGHLNRPGSALPIATAIERCPRMSGISINFDGLDLGDYIEAVVEQKV